MVGDIVTICKEPYFFKVIKEGKTVAYVRPLEYKEVPNGDGRTRYVPYNDKFASDGLIRVRFNKWYQFVLNKEIMYPWGGELA